MWTSLFLCALALGAVTGHSYGPPPLYSVCDNMRPSGLSPHRLILGNGSYDIVTNATLNETAGYFHYTAGETYSVMVLTKDPSVIFKGFLIQAWDPSDRRIGSFSPTNSTAQRLVDCSSINQVIPAERTIAHATRNFGISQTVKWTAPSTANGLVDFRFTLVRSYTEYFGPLSAASPDGSIPSDRPPLPPSVTVPTRAPEDYRIKARIPRGCSGTKCLTFVAIDTNKGNSSYLDIYLEGKADAWVALGFAPTPHMKNSSVAACSFNPQLGVVEALDTYNLPDTKNNVMQDVQRYYLHQGSYVSGRINCTMAREISARGGLDDFDLTTPFYLLFGVGQDVAARSLRRHSLHLINIPQVSQTPVIPASGKGNFGADTIYPPALTRVHGILMWIAWPVLACTGIFFAMWMRPVLQSGWWFHIHWALMISSLVVGLIGFASIFIAQYRKKGMIDFADIASSIYHFYLGIIAMTILTINPIISLFRCKPKSPNRWIYNLIHGYGLGMIGQILAIVNIGLGTVAYDYAMGSTIKLYWVFFAFVFVFVMVNAGLAINYVCKPKKSKDSDSETSNLLSINTAQDPSNGSGRQMSFLWGVVVGYLVLVAILTLIWIVEVAT